MPTSRRSHRRARGARAVHVVAVALGAGALVVAASCAGTTGAQVDVEAATTVNSTGASTTAPPDCAQMLPVEARAAQLLMVMVTTPQLATTPIANGTVGGFGLKGNQTRDVGTQVAQAVQDAPLPAFAAADEEGGTVQRLRQAAGTIPAAATVAKGSPEDAAAQAKEHAQKMKQLGFNMDFAPVADVGTGSGLGTRSYGTDPQTVSSFVDAIVPAISSAGVIPVVKHWPGIGGGKSDPHDRLPTLASIDSLRSKDLTTFDRAIAAGAPAIMVTHAAVPGLTRNGEPTSLSSAAITGELRGRQHFDGLVITDSLGMGAVAAVADQAEAAEQAIAAGADVALVSGSDAVPAAHARLVDAIGSGRIPPDQVLASVRRVLQAKGVDGQCLDAVAKYSSLAQAAATSSTTTTGSGSSSGTADTGINDTGTGSSSSGSTGSGTSGSGTSGTGSSGTGTSGGGGSRTTTTVRRTTTTAVRRTTTSTSFSTTTTAAG